MFQRFVVITILMIFASPITINSQIFEPQDVILSFGVNKGDQYEFTITRADPGFDLSWWGDGVGTNATLDISDDIPIDLSTVSAEYIEDAATQFEIKENHTIFEYTDFGGRSSPDLIGEIIFPISMKFPDDTVMDLYDIVRAYFYDNPISFTELPNALQLNWSSGWTYSWVISTTTGIIGEQIYTDNQGYTLAFNQRKLSTSEPTSSTSYATPSLTSSTSYSTSSPTSRNSTDVSSVSTSPNTISLPYPSILSFLVLLTPIIWRRSRSPDQL